RAMARKIISGKETQCLRGGIRQLVIEWRKAYTIFYRDVQLPDGAPRSERARHFRCDLSSMSRREARRLHDVLMDGINRQRGSVPAPTKSHTFQKGPTPATSRPIALPPCTTHTSPAIFHHAGRQFAFRARRAPLPRLSSHSPDRSPRQT